MNGRICLTIIVCMLVPQIAHARFLQSETLTLPTDGRAVKTSLPLNPAHQYHIVVSSTYNLRPFVMDCSSYDQVSLSFFGLVENHDRYTLCRPPLLFDGTQLQTSRWPNHELGSYYLQNTEIEFYIPTLLFYFWGTGSPLTLRTSTDLSHKVRVASVKIVDFMWEDEQRREAEQRERARQEALLQQRIEAERAEARALEERQRQQEERRLQLEQERAEAELRAKQRLANRYRTIAIAVLLVLLTIFIWWLIATGDSRRAEREAAAVARARADAERKEAERQAESQRRMQEKERQRQIQEEEEAERRDRFRTIQSRYGDALFAWRTDHEALERFAREHQHELLDPRRQKDIIDAYTAFYDDDLNFVEWLRLNHSELYHRIDEVFYYRVQALAESLGTQEKPRRPKLTPEERRAKFERYRERALERDRIQAEDRMAAIRQKLDLLQQFRDDLDSYDLDEDERDRLVKEFEDDLFAQTEEEASGTYKQV